MIFHCHYKFPYISLYLESLHPSPQAWATCGIIHCCEERLQLTRRCFSLHFHQRSQQRHCACTGTKPNVLSFPSINSRVIQALQSACEFVMWSSFRLCRSAWWHYYLMKRTMKIYSKNEKENTPENIVQQPQDTNFTTDRGLKQTME